MGRIIIDNQSDLPDAEAVRVVARVIDDGRISGRGKCYCYATVFKAPFVAVYAKVNKSSDKFIVSDDRGQPMAEGTEPPSPPLDPCLD